jgi:hypothetical protein
LIEDGSSWGKVFVLHQPITYHLEVPSIHFVELGDNIKQLLLIVSVWWNPQVRGYDPN